MSNFKLAFRALVKTPFVAAIAVTSLALGIGANTAMFSLFEQLLQRPLPVSEPGQLVNLSAPGPKPGSNSCNQAGDCDAVFSYRMFRDLEPAQTVFTGLAAHRLFGANLSYRGQTINGDGVVVSGNYFSVLGLQPAVGRLLGPDDDKTIGQSPVVVLSHLYWRTRFDSNPGVINETLIVNGQALTIVGVAPDGFDGTTLGARPQVYVPITMNALMQPGFTAWENRRNYWTYLFARLKPGVSIETAALALNGTYRSIINDIEAPLQTGMSEQTMTRFRAKQVVLTEGSRGQSNLHEGARPPVLILLGVTTFVLLIACANIANLLLVRGAGRAGEMAVRLSIGAGRWQLVRQLLFESVVMSSLGGVLGLVVAKWTLDLMGSLMPAEAAATMEFVLQPRAMVYAAVLALGTGILFGLFPALNSTSPDLVAILKDQSGQKGASRGAARFRMSLATLQIALSMALLIGAGLFIRSLFNITRADLGLQPENVLTFAISPQLNGYSSDNTRALFERLEDELAALPGVSSVSAATVPVLGGSNWGTSVSVEGFEAGPDTDTHSNYNTVGPDYFKTIGVSLLAGRDFTRADTIDSPKVAIVNEAFAKKFGLGRDGVGKRMAQDSGVGVKLDIEIVGLIPNTKYSQVKQEPPPLLFRPYRQNQRLGFINFYVKTAFDPEQLLPAVAGVVARLDANLPVENLKTLPQQVRENTFPDRLVSMFSVAFAVLATLLAAVGLYGVLAYTVAQRTREIGLRMALGADGGRVRGMVMKQVGWMIVIGGVIGLAGGIGLGKLAESELFELKGSDPTVLAVASITLVLVALGAGFLPAHRASQIDPMTALRYE